MLLKDTKDFRVENPIELKRVSVVSLIAVNNTSKLGGTIFVSELGR
jgi:hypothetical protein